MTQVTDMSKENETILQEKTDYELLWMDFESRSDEVRQVLWNRYQRLVFKHCNRFYGFTKDHMEYSDLVQECWLAFNQAMDKNDPNRITHDTFKFYTIFLWKIKKRFKSISRKIRNHLTYEWNFGDYVETFETFEEGTSYSRNVPEKSTESDERFTLGSFESRYEEVTNSMGPTRKKIFYSLMDGNYMTEVSRQLGLPYSRVSKEAKQIRVQVSEAFPEAFHRVVCFHRNYKRKGKNRIE